MKSPRTYSRGRESGSSSKVSWVIFGATARLRRNAVTCFWRIYVRPLLARFMVFNAAASGISSDAIDPVAWSVSRSSTTLPMAQVQQRPPL